MRAVGKRKAKNQPCKSPSPDIANRNIIKNTSIELQNIRHKIQQAQQKNFRFELQSSSSQMPQLNVTLQLKYRQLYEELSRVKIENSQLKEHNDLLGQQNKKLRQDASKISNSAIQSIRIKTQHEPFQEQNFNFSSGAQNKSLLQELAQEKSKIEQAERYIDHLRNNESKYRSEIQRLIGQNRYYEQQLINCSQKVTSVHQQVYNKINDLNLKINKLQTLKKVIDEKHSRLFAEGHAQKTPPSTGKFQHRPKSMLGSYDRERAVESFLFTSPEGHSKEGENVERLEHENHELRSQLNSRKQQLERSTMQKQNLLAILKEHQRHTSSLSSTPMSQSLQQPSHQQISRLQVINQELQSELSQLKNENRQIGLKLQQKEQEYEEERNKLLESIEHYRKLLEGYKGELRGKECEQCKFKDRQIAFLKQCLQKKQIKQRDDYNSRQRQFQTKIQDLQFKLRQSEKNSNWEIKNLKEQNQNICMQKQKLEQQVLQLNNKLNFVRDHIQIDEATRLLNQNYAFFCDLEGYCNKKEEDYNKNIMGYREKFLRKEEELASMSSQLAMKSKEVEILQIQLSRLKELRSQFKGQVDQGLNWEAKKAHNREQKEKNSQFRSNQLKIIDQLKEGNQKLREVNINLSPSRLHSPYSNNITFHHTPPNTLYSSPSAKPYTQ